MKLHIEKKLKTKSSILRHLIADRPACYFKNEIYTNEGKFRSLTEMKEIIDTELDCDLKFEKMCKWIYKYLKDSPNFLVYCNKIKRVVVKNFKENAYYKQDQIITSNSKENYMAVIGNDGISLNMIKEAAEG